MKKFAEVFKSKYSNISVQEVVDTWLEEDDEGQDIEVEKISYNVNSIPGLENLTLNLQEEDEFLRLDSLIESKPIIFSDYLGGQFNNQIEVVLERISKGSFSPQSPTKSTDIEINYQGAEIVVSITRAISKTSIGFIATNMVGVRRMPYRMVVILKGLSARSPSEIETDTRNILRSALFDLEYTYGVCFEVTNLENLKSSKSGPRRLAPRLPVEPIRLMYKNYVPELIEYFHMAEKVDHLPFKYICYFHVLEYFMDKSAYSVVTRKVKQLLLSPDFHLRSAEYISNAVNIIKLETERNTTDKIKIGRVISEYTQFDSIQKHLSSIGVLDHFKNEHSLTFSKPFNVTAVKFDSDKLFIESIAKRVYAIRCSIVHSNPEFDESKAVPFLPTHKNIDFLRVEIELIKEIARTIISNTML